MATSQQDLINTLEATFKRLRDLLEVKGGEYAPGADALINFKQSRDEAGLASLKQAWAVFAAKHWRSVMNYIKDDVAGVVRQRSEPILGRIDDLINYLLLLHVIIESGEDVRVVEKRYTSLEQRVQQVLADMSQIKHDHSDTWMLDQDTCARCKLQHTMETAAS
jgi:hypothetical protein